MIPSTLAGTCSTITSGLVISKTTLTNRYPKKAHYASRQPLRNYPCDQERRRGVQHRARTHDTSGHHLGTGDSTATNNSPIAG